MPSFGLLRILATTDLHMHLLDRADEEPLSAQGLAALSDVVAARRAATGGACLLLDNGDFLYGTAPAEMLVDAADHPLARAFNLLGYDAVNLGNHEFDGGVGALERFLAQLHCPAVSANIDSRPAWQAFAVCDRKVLCADGRVRPLRVGVTGFAPPSLTKAPHVSVGDILPSAHSATRAMRQAGAEIIIGLFHGGIDYSVNPPPEAANNIARLAGFDALILGHTHSCFPDAALPSGQGIDQSAGTIYDTPAVMPGHFGLELGEIDLSLKHDGRTWRVDGHQVRRHGACKPSPSHTRLHKKITTYAIPSEKAAVAYMDEKIGTTGRRLHNHFATVQPDPVAQLLANVMRQAASDQIGVPCRIAAVAPAQPLGAGGEIDLPPGPIKRRDAMRLFPFMDRICAVRRTGRQIHEWLAQSAAHYTLLKSGASPSPLISKDSAGYHCDALFGLRYAIDLGVAARFDSAGRGTGVSDGRITDICLDGTPLCDDGSYLVATTDFRAAGGGGFATIPPQDILWTSSSSLRDVLVTAIGLGAAQDLSPEPVWRFLGPKNSAARIARPAGATLASPDPRLSPGITAKADQLVVEF